MKLKLKDALLICIACLVFFCCSRTEKNNDAQILFSEKEFDFGTLEFKKEAHYSFNFMNPGNTPLVIYNVETSCGCTVPEWTKKPIRPGANGEVKIKYDSKFPGYFQKTITVHYNGKDSPVTLRIKGSVDYGDELVENNEKNIDS